MLEGISMRKVEWPGVTTAAALVLIIASIIVGSRDEFHLKDWQTLIAGVLALAGGALAYIGAMAKVEQDADVQRREFLRRQLSLYLKLDITVRNFRDTASERETEITFVDPGGRITVGELALKSRPRLKRLGIIWTSFHVTSFAK
jgi:hypothetical protein